MATPTAVLAFRVRVEEPVERPTQATVLRVQTDDRMSEVPVAKV